MKLRSKSKLHRNEKKKILNCLQLIIHEIHEKRKICRGFSLYVSQITIEM